MTELEITALMSELAALIPSHLFGMILLLRDMGSTDKEVKARSHFIEENITCIALYALYL